ncbi:MAG: transposase [Clostridia bacterium]|nr:transposase [Clostridia bacterium]
MSLPKRKPNRLKDYDYSSNGAYFLTICTKDKQKILCDIVRVDDLGDPIIKLTEIGKIVDKYIVSANKIDNVTVDKYVVMPNHIHMIVSVENFGGSPRSSTLTSATIPNLVSALKRFINAEAGKNIFHRSYHDHIIRDENDYLRIWEYIDTNPVKWTNDCYY